jgi:hypothetical protein
VASVVSELAEVLPKLGSCHGAALFTKSTGAFRRHVAARVHTRAPLCVGGASGRLARLEQAGVRSSARSAGQVSRSVDNQNGVDTGAVVALLKEARRVIIAARGALF